MKKFGLHREKPCILCHKHKERYDNGHFIERGRMATRFHPMNMNKECTGCNNSHESGYRPDKGFPYGLAIDERYGPGAAKFLYDLSRPTHQWSLGELLVLKDAAKQSYRAYETTYYELRPTARFIFKAA
jgi:hypothetical protein